MTADQLKEIVYLIAAFCAILAFLFPIIRAGYRYLKSKKLYFSKQMILAILLHGTILLLVRIYIDTPGITLAVSVMLAALVYLVGDAYEDMIGEYKDLTERAVNVGESVVDQNKKLRKEIERHKNLTERAVNAGEESVDINKRLVKEIEEYRNKAESATNQSMQLVKVIEKFTGQSLLDEEDES